MAVAIIFNRRLAVHAPFSRVRITVAQAMRTEPLGAPPTLGASSIQVFQGEDPEALQRKRYQQEQVRYWRQEKAAEVDARTQAETEAEAEYVAFCAQIKALSEAHEESKQAIMAGRRKGAFYDNITLAERKQRQAEADRQKQAEIEAYVCG